MPTSRRSPYNYRRKATQSSSSKAKSGRAPTFARPAKNRTNRQLRLSRLTREERKKLRFFSLDFWRHRKVEFLLVCVLLAGSIVFDIYVYHHSFVSVAAQSTIVGDAPTEGGLNRPGVLFFGGFEATPWTATMKPTLPGGHGSYMITAAGGYNNTRSLRSTYLQGSYGSYSSPVGTSSTIFKIPFGSNGINIGTYNDLYFRFLVKFQSGFQFAKSGKLPGLAGGTDNSAGLPPNGYDGWSGRLDWVANGGIISYMYVPGIAKYGLELHWQVDGQNNLLQPGKWQCLEMHYRMNTPGQNDGIAEGWYNRHLAMRKTGMNFRSTDQLAIDNVMFSTFFGGATSDYASPQTQHADFDDLVVAQSFIGCPSGIAS